MAKQVGYHIETTVTSLTESYHTEHKVGDKFKIYCHDTADMWSYLKYV